MYFGRFEDHAKQILEVEADYSWEKLAPIAIQVHLEPFAYGLSCFAAARTTKKRKYKLYGKKMLAKIKSWLDKGNPNVSHYKPFLEAEHAALKGRSKVAVRLYDETIRLCSRSGYVHDAALAHERCGQYHLELANKRKAMHHFQEALKKYGDWGAESKVQHLKHKYSDLLL